MAHAPSLVSFSCIISIAPRLGKKIKNRSRPPLGIRFLLSFFIFLPSPPLALRPAPSELPLAFSFAFGADASAVVRQTFRVVSDALFFLVFHRSQENLSRFADLCISSSAVHHDKNSARHLCATNLESSAISIICISTWIAQTLLPRRLNGRLNSIVPTGTTECRYALTVFSRCLHLTSYSAQFPLVIQRHWPARPAF